MKSGNILIASLMLLGCLGVAWLYWYVDRRPTPPDVEWSEGPPVSAISGRCDRQWWVGGLSKSLRRGKTLRGIAGTEGYTCSFEPGLYERLFNVGSWPSLDVSDRERQAREALAYLYELLLEDDQDKLCLSPGWRSGSKPAYVGSRWIRYDGVFFVGNQRGVPSYLYLPRIPIDHPFEATGGVVVVHGHDAGRTEVVHKKEGYQAAIADRLADGGQIVLVPDNISWAGNHPAGVPPAKHSVDYKSYMDEERANGMISRNLVDLFHGVTLLTELRVQAQEDLGYYTLVTPDTEGGIQAVSSVGISGLSYGAQIAAYMLLDERVSAYLLASGLIDTCDILHHDHHRCQLIRPLEGVATLWDLITAGAVLSRERYGLGPGFPAIRLQQGEKDKILRAWGRVGLSELRRMGDKLSLPHLTVRVSEMAGHSYLPEDAVRFFQKALQ